MGSVCLIENKRCVCARLACFRYVPICPLGVVPRRRTPVAENRMATMATRPIVIDEAPRAEGLFANPIRTVRNGDRGPQPRRPLSDHRRYEDIHVYEEVPLETETDAAAGPVATSTPHVHGRGSLGEGDGRQVGCNLLSILIISSKSDQDIYLFIFLFLWLT